MVRRFVRLSSLLVSAAVLPALAPAQKVVAWGNNTNGQLNVPALQATQIAAGGFHGLLLPPDGVPWGWGKNDYGQATYPGGLTTRISGGLYHTLVLRPNGSVTGFGWNVNGQCNPPAGLVAIGIAAGSMHSVALRPDGTVAAWGDGSYGQLDVPAGLVATGLAAGGSHSLALRQNGTVVGWGQNDYGQINVPAGLSSVAQVSTSRFFSMALRTDGTVATWGDNGAGQLNVPVGLTATQISAGAQFALALRPNGTVAAWGTNSGGQLNVPGSLTGVLQISAGYSYGLAMVAHAHCLLNQPEVYSGYGEGGVVKLAFPAPAGGLTVGLASDDPNVHVPDSVRVPAGALSADFFISTDFVVGTEERTATIRTVAGSTDAERRTVSFPFKFIPVKATVEFAKPSLIGGSTAKTSLKVSIDRDTLEPTTLQITSSDPSLATFPASITLPGLATEATVNILTTSPVVTTRTVSALLSHNGKPAGSATLTLTPIRANVTLATPTLTSGTVGEGGVYLNAAAAKPQTVSLASGDPTVVVPATVTVAAGARLIDFPIATTPVGTNRTVPITATINGNPFTANLRVLAVPGVKSLTLPASVSGNGKVTGTVRLHIAAKAGGTVVNLTSSDPSLSVPATVTVPEGQYATTFQATSSDVSAVANVLVTASAGASSSTAGVTVNPLTISGLTISTTTTNQGATVSFTVTLNTTVAVDTLVTFTSADSSLVPVPTTVIVSAGGKTATVDVTVGTTATTKNVRITAEKNGSRTYRTLRINP